MYARVASWDGGDPEAIRASAEGIRGDSEQGPPEGVPAVGFLLLVDPDNGRSVGIALFETEEDMRTGDAKLNEMSPPGDGMGTRRPVEFFEVALDMRA